MLNNALLFLLDAVLGLLTLAFLLRFYFQVTRVSFQNQAVQILVSLTNFAVLPMRKFTAAFKNFFIKKWDVSTILLAYLSQLLLKFLTLLLTGYPYLLAGNTFGLKLLLMSFMSIVNLSLSIFLYAVLIQAILSWVNPNTPIAPILNSLTNPILRFTRRIIPMAGNIDLSPLAFIIVAQLLLTTILIPIENNILTAF
jgi:YggT family protein